MPKLLWANMQCLADPTSGASLSIRNALKQLVHNGWEVRILGATCFDSPNGTALFPETEKKKLYKPESFKGLKIRDGVLEHDLINTNSSNRDEIFAKYEQVYFKTFTPVLEKFNPDIVWSYGGRPLDALVANDAKLHRKVVASYLVNGGYHTSRWARDYDIIITDSDATKSLYKKRLGLNLKKIGKFLDIADANIQLSNTKNILVVNPSPAKGGLLILQVAHELIKRGRKDIKFRVAESRGNLSEVVDAVAHHYGVTADYFAQTIVNLGTVSDMFKFYQSGRILFAPSLWYESGSRAIAEATCYGRPVITTDNGGNKEMAGPSATILKLPTLFNEKPYNKLLPENNVSAIADIVTQYIDNQEFYKTKHIEAIEYGRTTHDLKRSGSQLSEAFMKLLK